jgi:N-acetylglutamate synthase-like GNAT family acetyltransferase
VLAEEEEDFDLAERSAPSRPLAADEAAAYLREPTVLHWVAEEGGVVVGHLLSFVELRRAGEPRQLLLYEIGVRQASRRRGVGTVLVQEMRRWMSDEEVDEAWVLADNPNAEAFYAACGFVPDDQQPVQMTLRL